MKVFGITGGVGAGKSEVLTYLGQNYDATVIQADEAGYLVMLPGGECYGEIVKLFGRQITTETGELDRKRIAEIVFQDEEKLKALNAIVHPAVKRYIKKAIAAAEKAGTEYVFVEAALLIEEKYDEICDELWYIYADEEVRKERLIEGRGYSEKKVREIMANQLSEDEFSSHCDFEIDNSGDFEETKKQLETDENEFAKEYKNFENMLNKKGFDSIDSYKESILEDEQITLIEEQIEKYRDELNRLKSEIAVLNDMLADESIIDTEEENSYRYNILELGNYKKGDKVSLEIILLEDDLKITDYVFSTFSETEFKEKINLLNSNDSFKMEEFKTNYIKGKINVSDSNQILYTSIPVDNGWNIYIDGRKVEYDVIMDTFIGLTLDSGEHTIEFEYIPRGFTSGMCVSMLSIALLGYAIYSERKKRVNKN